MCENLHILQRQRCWRQCAAVPCQRKDAYTRYFKLNTGNDDVINIDVLFSGETVDAYKCLLCTPTLDQRYREKKQQYDAEGGRKDTLFRLNAFRRRLSIIRLKRQDSRECVHRVLQIEDQLTASQLLSQQCDDELSELYSELSQAVASLTMCYRREDMIDTVPRFYYGPVGSVEVSKYQGYIRHPNVLAADCKAFGNDEGICDWSLPALGQKQIRVCNALDE